MSIILEKNLPHQLSAINAINAVFNDVDFSKPKDIYANLQIDVHSQKINDNIKEIQNNIHPQIRGNNEIKDYLNIDIKMETGTGKTYVYTKAIFELHKNFGLNKFIILVPSIAIKAGTQSFIKSEYVKRHFRDDYNAEIELCILESKKGSKKRDKFPSAVREFVTGSNLVKNKMHFLM